MIAPADPVFLDLDDVLLIHEEQLARYGGGAGIRDAGLLDSALGTPRATFGGDVVHENLFAMAAAYAFHVAQNQPFVDGNKRTGLLAALVFLDLNGVVVPDREGRLYDAISPSRSGGWTRTASLASSASWRRTRRRRATARKRGPSASGSASATPGIGRTCSSSARDCAAWS